MAYSNQVDNKYPSREAVDLLNLQYHFMPHDSVASLRGGKQTGVKRWVKEVVYARLPGGFRAFAWFFYRYVIPRQFTPSPTCGRGPAPGSIGG